MNEEQKFAVALNEFDKAYESGRFFQNYHLAAFGYFVAISGGGLALLASSISDPSYASLFCGLLLMASLIFHLYNRRIERHMTKYYELSCELESKLGMTKLLETQDALQVRVIGFTHVMRGFYWVSIALWLSLSLFNAAKAIHLFR